MKFKYFLKQIDNPLYYEYLKEVLVDKDGPKKETDLQQFVNKMKKPVFAKTTKIADLKKISQLAPDHPAKLYVMKRRIPPHVHHKLYYAPKFKAWTNSQIANKFESLEFDDGRIIIPLLDEAGDMFGYQGRSLKKNDNMKYITILLNDDRPKVFGLDSIDKSKRVYVLEGPLDALFLSNSIASCGGKLETNIEACDIENHVIVYDNEPRGKETIRKMEDSINAGHNICIWPNDIIQKDINDMVLAGFTPLEIKNIINENTYDNLSAKMQMLEWKKI